MPETRKGGELFIVDNSDSEASTTDCGALDHPLRKCIDAGGVDCGVREREIDEHVTALYGL